MAIVKPFKGIRPGENLAEEVISLPYDVMNRKEAEEMASEKPNSFLHISRSEIDLPEVDNPYDKSVYEKAKENLGKFLENGVLIQEESPALYIYSEIMDGRRQTGIVACVSVDDYQNNIIKKHEFTRVEKEIDRINHFDVCNANTEPVFLTYRENRKLSSIIEGYVANNKPVYDLIAEDGITHQLWTITDEEILKAIVLLFDDIPALYIADGHHRTASACKISEKRRAENPGYTGEEEFNFFMAAIFPDTELKIFDYNRVVKDLNGNSKEEFFDKVKKAGFKLEEKGKKEYSPKCKHEFSMYIDGKWYSLTAKNEIIPNNVIGALDVSILQENLLSPILGIDDPRTNKRIDFVGGIRGLKELERRAESDMCIGIAVYPVGINDLLEVSDNDLVMPPKSTWFEPKLGSGLFVHKL
ncbi:MAG: DUF1015 domain-containing protein [Peptostreptococcaceae bacterium]|nr:DUF1015 domain-containing protein [Peptostreptococcaceae bacterium]